MQPLFLPGSVFIVVCIVTYLIHRMKAAQIAETWRIAGGQLAGAAIARRKVR